MAASCYSIATKLVESCDVSENKPSVCLCFSLLPSLSLSLFHILSVTSFPYYVTPSFLPLSFYFLTSLFLPLSPLFPSLPPLSPPSLSPLFPIQSVVALSHKLVSKYYSDCSVTDVEKMEAHLIQTPDIASARSLHTIQDYIKKVGISRLKII